MRVDVIIVAYRSALHLRECVQPLCGVPDVSVIVVDNACPEGSPQLVEDLPLTIVHMDRNAGFAAGSNAGAHAGRGDAILFLNPDARIEPDSVRLLGAAVGYPERDSAAVGPRIVNEAGEIQQSMRRAPRLRSAFGEALFMHRVLRHANWPTEIVRSGYETEAEPEWLIGAAFCVRRDAFEEVGGFDERFFLYREDADICKRLRDRGYRVLYQPRAVARHTGAASAPRLNQAALIAEARHTYARLHESSARRIGFHFGFALHEFARLPVATFGVGPRARVRAHALATAFGRKARRPEE